MCRNAGAADDRGCKGTRPEPDVQQGTGSNPFHRCLPRTLAHSLFDDKTGADVLLFAKDPVQTTETLLEKHDIKGNVSVMGISKLKNEYKEYEKKRKLALSYDLFLADDRYVDRLAPTQ